MPGRLGWVTGVHVQIMKGDSQLIWRDCADSAGVHVQILKGDNRPEWRGLVGARGQILKGDNQK